MKHRLIWHKQTGHAQLNFFLIKSKSVPDNWGVEREREKSTNIELGLRVGRWEQALQSGQAPCRVMLQLPGLQLQQPPTSSGKVDTSHCQ